MGIELTSLKKEYKEKAKLSHEDLENLKWRLSLIKEHQFVVDSMILYKEIWLGKVLAQEGFDTSKPYEVSLSNGEVKNVVAKENGGDKKSS